MINPFPHRKREKVSGKQNTHPLCAYAPPPKLRVSFCQPIGRRPRTRVQGGLHRFSGPRFFFLRHVGISLPLSLSAAGNLK